MLPIGVLLGGPRLMSKGSSQPGFVLKLERVTHHQMKDSKCLLSCDSWQTILTVQHKLVYCAM